MTAAVVERCKLCVIPKTRPDTEFVDGVCSACIAYERREKIDWQARKERLIEVLAYARETAKERRNTYDCIVPSSGGKDSHYQVLTLLEMGARPLVLTASTCHLTPIGRANIDNLARYATTVEFSPNKTVRATLNRLGLTLVGDISWPEHVSIFTMPFGFAAATDIPYIFYGENPQDQYGGPLAEQDAVNLTLRWRSEFGGFLGLRPLDLVGQEGLRDEDLADYMLPALVVGVQAHFLGQYIPWDSFRNGKIAAEAGMLQRLPCDANLWIHENLDNAQTGLHDYTMWRKYGYSRGTAQAACDIRAGRISRHKALEWCAKHEGIFPTVYAGVHYREVLDRLNMSHETLRRSLDQFTNWALHPNLNPATAFS